jgi:hypothetical protein
MVSNNYRRVFGQCQKRHKFLKLLSVTPEGNVFKSVNIRGYVLLLLKLRVLADAAMAVVRVLVSWETAVDDAFAIQT